jgi:DNA-binding transcriptional regulator LsrR (DeoR family)
VKSIVRAQRHKQIQVRTASHSTRQPPPDYTAANIRDLERELVDSYDCLTEAAVVPGRADWEESPMRDALREALVAHLAEAAARLIDRVVRTEAAVAVPWGQTGGLVAAHFACQGRRGIPHFAG